MPGKASTERHNGDNRQTMTIGKTKDSELQSWFGLALSILAWGVASVVAITQYSSARSRINDAYDEISAVQIQQVNSEAMLVIVLAVSLAMAVTSVAIVAHLRGLVVASSQHAGADVGQCGCFRSAAGCTESRPDDRAGP